MRGFLSLIPGEYRKGAVRVALLIPVKALLDLVGVAALLPVMMLVMDPDSLEKSFLGRIYNAWDFSGQSGFALFVLSAVVVIIVLKILFSLLIINSQNKYLMSLYRNLSSRLFISLYSRGLLFIKNQNSAKLTFNVIGVCYNYVMSYLGGFLKLIGDAAFIVLMIAALFIWSPKATAMAVAAFIPVAIIYILIVRKPLARMSEKSNEARREQNKLLIEAFKGYSEVQVNDAFEQIHKRFEKGLGDISSFRLRTVLIQHIPAYMLELSVVLVVAMMILFTFTSPASVNTVFLGVFAVSLMKLLPSVKGLVAAITVLHTTAYTREIIEDLNTPGELRLLHESEVKPMKFEHGIELDNISFTFPDDDKAVLSNVSLKIPKGMRFGIKGRTGCGKTTLFNVLLGLYFPDEGSVRIDGTVLDRENVNSWHKIIGYVPQEVFVADSTILENIALGFEKSSIDRDKVMKVLEQASLKDFIDTLPNGIDTRIGEAGCRLSGGQKQRIGIARALYKDAQVLFFDEATSSLDSKTEEEVNMAIESLSETEKDLTIIVISHRESTLSFCQDILEL